MKRISFKKIIVILVLVFIFIVSSIIFPLCYTNSWMIRGQIGDTFNIISSVATLVASIIAIITLIFYGNQIIEQKNEINFGIKRQDEIEKLLSEISLTLGQNTKNSQINLEIKALLNIIEVKRIQIDNAKLEKMTNTTISNLEIELSENIKKLEKLLKTI